MDLLKSLNAISKGRITILAGSGVNSENAIKFKEAGLSELHASASSKIETHDSIFSMPVTVSGSNKIEAIKSVIKNE